MLKGEIWWADLPSPRGSEPGKSRPVLVIQADSFNRSQINTVICATITSNTGLSSSPGNLLLEKKDSHLEKTSVVNFSQLITVDKSYFTEMVSMLPKLIISKINQCAKLVLDLDWSSTQVFFWFFREKTLVVGKESNKVFNLTYLGVTTLGKQGSRQPKRRFKQR